jgi:uncharacterized protein (DUF1800 family)
MATREELAHLLRRATFGPRAEDLDAAERTGWDATLASLLTPAAADAGAAATPPPSYGPDPAAQLGKGATREQRQQAQRAEREQLTAVTVWWLDRMVAADHQLREKLTFFWHGHWATSARKVKSARLMLGQQQTLYRLGAGDFGALAHAMVRDPALVFWLDGQRSTAKAPNENLARELMELFTLGIGNYTESDVKEGARALTGWQVDRAAGTATFNKQRHDAGSKTILGHTGAFGADEFVDLLLGHEANARFVTGRLWFRFASGEPLPDDVRERLVAAYRGGRDVTAALRAVFGDPRFAASRGQLVKQPVEWAVGAMRQLGIRPGSLKPEQQRQVVRALEALGQVPLAPPSVGGWPAGSAWLTTSATQLRLRAADLLAGFASPAAMGRLTAVPPAQRAEALTRLLVVDAFTERTKAALAAPGTAERDQRRALAIALASPEYIVH